MTAMSEERREYVSPLFVAARLTEEMSISQRMVSERTHVPIHHLLDMIELKRPFNRSVLRY